MEHVVAGYLRQVWGMGVWLYDGQSYIRGVARERIRSSIFSRFYQ